MTRIKNNQLKTISFNLNMLDILMVKRVSQITSLLCQALLLSTVSSKKPQTVDLICSGFHGTQKMIHITTDSFFLPQQRYILLLFYSY